MKDKIKTPIRVLVFLTGLTIAGIIVFSVFLYATPQRFLAPENLKPTELGWFYEQDGVKVPVLPGEEVPVTSDSFTMTKDVAYAGVEGNYLMFKSERQAVQVLVDDELIYSMGAGSRITKLSATGYIVVELPEPIRPYKLSITYSQLYGGEVHTSPMYFGSMNDIAVFLALKSFSTFVVMPLWLVLAAALGIVMIMLILNGKRDHRLTCLAFFLLIMVLWNFTDAPFSCLFPINPQVLSTVSFYMIMLMPIPILAFSSLCCYYSKAPFVNIALSVVILNAIVQSILFFCGAFSLFDMVIVSQSLIFCALVYGFIVLLLDYRAEKTKVGLFQMLGMGVTGLLGVSIILLYWFGPNEYYQMAFQATVLFFLLASLIIIIFSLLQRRYDLRVMNAELNAMKTIAEEDQLTGLSNRRAFDNKLDHIQKLDDIHTNAILVFLDVNGLKYTNDKYGHLAGDELLIAATRAIRHTFEDVGTVYRIGGDEFAVVVDDASVNIDNRYRKMDEYIADYNKKAEIPLSIARGSSALFTSHGRRASISDWKMRADKNMYKDKVKGRLVSVNGTAQDYLEIISSFVSAVDAKDSYTADHSERVAILSDTICELLGVSEASSNQIHIAACLHDIGKIGIPDAILLKPGSLSDEEYKTIQGHTMIGEDIVKHTRAFYEVSQIIRHHHERYDGSGFPDGVSGKNIPFGARVVAIADSIDAMTSNRSYRSARTPAYCREEIEKNLGKMYDPAIGNIVLENWPVIETIIMSEHILGPEELDNIEEE